MSPSFLPPLGPPLGLYKKGREIRVWERAFDGCQIGGYPPAQPASFPSSISYLPESKGNSRRARATNYLIPNNAIERVCVFFSAFTYIFYDHFFGNRGSSVSCVCD